MISQDTIDKIFSAAKIEEVVADFITLKKAGANYKACCPFHSERSASFVVSPQKNIFKCFGCGKSGNAVTFLMEHENLSYPEALHRLAHKYHIDIEDKELTPEELVKQRTRESMFCAYEAMQTEYIRQLQLPENKVAKDYAYKRWGEKYCLEMGIGYCPKEARIIDTLGISSEVSDMLRLKNKGGYDFYNGRITIPIRDRQSRITSFTARDICGSSIKYLNSSDSDIYSKSNSLFGIDIAWREGSRADSLYVVEGAPDCMRLHSIGVANAVAPLGTSLTDKHFDLMKRVAKHLCFLPDADPPKQDQEFGPGINAVIKSGEAAVKAGFSVSVKPIPMDEEKNDPDSYCTSKAIFDALDEQDYILWLASLLFKDCMTLANRSIVLDRIAGIMAYIDNETIIEMYISQLTRYALGKREWKKAIDSKRSQLAEEKAKAKAEKESDMYRQFGFNVEKNKYYYSISENGGIYVWSNFTMRPLFHIKDTINPKRLYMLRNEYGVEELVELKQEDLVSMQKFMVRVEGLGNFIWKATQRELNKLKSYLYEKTETAEEIVQLGWHKKGFFSFGNGIYHDGHFLKVDDYGIVRLPKANYYLPAHSKIYRDDAKLFQFERRFVHLGLSTISMRKFTDQLFLVFGDKGRIGFLFFLATLFRDIVTAETRSFPILNLFGPKATGKSELGHTLLAFFEMDNVPPNIQNSTIFALNSMVASVANALVHIDEYKNDLDITKNEFLKGLWDGTGRTRKNMDTDNKTETTSVDCGVILSGQEMPTADIALFSRLIFLSFERSEFTNDEKREYQILKTMRSNGLTHLTLQLLDLRKKVENSFRQMYHDTMSDIGSKLQGLAIEDRILLNWLSPLALFRCIEASIDTELTYKQMLELSVSGIINQNSKCKENNELARFWNVVKFLASEGEIIEGADYVIRHVTKFKSNKVNSIWSEGKAILLIQKTRIFDLYKKHSKVTGEKPLPKESLMYYLENSAPYLGEKNQRYELYRKGVPVYDEKIQRKDGKFAAKTHAQLSYCFDYTSLSEMFELNINFSNDNENDEEESDPDNQEQNLPFL